MAKKNGDDANQVEGVHMPGKEVEKRLLEAGSSEELDEIHEILKGEGVPDGTVRGTISKLRKKGKLIFETALTETKDGQVQPLPVEAIVKQLKLPIIVDGQHVVFDAGVHYGMNTIVMGIRLAQELSRMGVSQASPVIRMAAEMRKAEGMSAQEAGQVAAENALAGAIQYMSQQKADIATVPNPMMGIMARAMEPAIMQVFGNMFGAFAKQPGQQGQQPQMGTNLPPGWTTSEEKLSEEPTK